MVTKKEDTPQRIARRKYEEMNKEKRRLASSNFQTMLPRELYDELDAFLKERHMTKVEFIRRAYEIMENCVIGQTALIFPLWARNEGKKEAKELQGDGE